MKQPRRVSYRQLKLLESEVAIRVDERVRGEVITPSPICYWKHSARCPANQRR